MFHVDIGVLLLQGIEDYMGDMDFKMAGSKHGVTALQVTKLYLLLMSSSFVLRTISTLIGNLSRFKHHCS